MAWRGKSGPGSLHRLGRRVVHAEAGRRLADLLTEWLAADLARPAPRSRVRAMIAAGVVRVDGAVVRAPGRVLRAGQRVEAQARLESLVPPTERTDRPFELASAAILYRDAALLAVDKPPGLPTHATADPARASLVGAVERFLRAEGREPYVAVHQRLDRDTSGVVLLALDRAANEGLARAFERREVHKTYVALAASPSAAPPERFRVAAPLAVPGGRRVEIGGEGAREAVTDVIVRERLARALLLEVWPRTGRKHQIRAHLSHVGAPILGDTLYGGPVEPGLRRLMLHAARLALPHPLSGGRLVVSSPLPEDFRQALERARRERRPGQGPD